MVNFFKTWNIENVKEIPNIISVESLPTTYIIDKDGYVFARLAKPTTKEEITNIIEGMLQ